MYADSLTESMKRISFARVCIEINDFCDLVDSFDLFMGDRLNPKLGENVEILVEYQCKQKICTECKSFGHSIMTCPKLKPLHFPSENDSIPKLKQEWRRVNKRDAPLVSSPQLYMEPPLGSLKVDEVIFTCNAENEPSLCPTNLPIHDQFHDLSERVVDTSYKFVALEEDDDYCNYQCNDQCNDQWLSRPTESYSKKKEKKQTAKKGEFNVCRRVDESIGGCSRITVAVEEFAECRQASELDDLRFLGFLHTWCNKRSNGCISKKLDRVLVKNEWLVKFVHS
ncbi:hypothetical protein Dsin_032158 [Dipteronia sinensis]|uniref:Uncharacterized protein n=1 Tax=Dipteronia sinensis TaxID=43782 RepID=A0AAD9ZMU2_9ROSI|nr:hypothetical protein Dsin_032158 [Dipteronia sinensis]